MGTRAEVSTAREQRKWLNSTIYAFPGAERAIQCLGSAHMANSSDIRHAGMWRDLDCVTGASAMDACRALASLGTAATSTNPALPGALPWLGTSASQV